MWLPFLFTDSKVVPLVQHGKQPHRKKVLPVPGSELESTNTKIKREETEARKGHRRFFTDHALISEDAAYRTSCSVFFVFPPQPYVNIHGQLVRPPSRESDEFLRPESLRSSRDALTPEPEMPVRPRQPRGSEFDDRGEPEINYFSYLV